MSETKAVSLFGAKTDAMPAHLQQYIGDANLGNESVSAEDMPTPVLDVLQSLSPQVDGDEGIPGAKAGMLCLTVTSKLFTSVYAINLKYTKNFAVFRKRQRGKGFHGNYDTKLEAEAKVRELPGTADDYEIVETANHIVLLLNDDGSVKQPALIRLKSTGLAISRQWNADLTARNEGHARFATVWTLSTDKKTNDKGTWYVLNAEYAGWASEELYAEAKKMFNAFNTNPPQGEAEAA
ncbi:MAG: hypothetical protein E6R03_14580 [Hyphomicrobiaceae bacterium]|nr:MAG: hypothetical protein E6R03_14580 [Hyphomicrobiaceae bacterium]